MLSRHLKLSLAAILMFVCSIAHAAEPSQDGRLANSVERSALEAVKRRIDAFNDHDIDGYLAAHHEDVQIFEFPDKSIGVGRAHLQRIFGPLLEKGIGKTEVRHQVAIENKIVSEEQTNFGSTQPETIVAIYTVKEGLISSIYLVEAAN